MVENTTPVVPPDPASAHDQEDTMITPKAPIGANAPTFDRTWTETGAQLFDAARATREGHNYATGRDAVVTGIDRLTWVELPRGGGDVSLPFSPGESLSAVICGLGLRDVRRIAWDGSVDVGAGMRS
jgi:hypothetical protein